MGGSPLTQETEVQAKFTPISGIPQIMKIFSRISNSFPSGVIWTKDQKLKFKVRLGEFSQIKKKLFFLAPIHFNLKELESNLAKNKNKSCFINLIHLDGSFFFVSEFETHEKSTLQFSLPQLLYRVQRRKNDRFTIPIGTQLKLEYKCSLSSEKIYQQKILDISITGLAFSCSKKDSLVLKKGEFLEPLQFRLKSRNFYMRAKIIHTKPLSASDSSDAIKVGIQFENPSKEDQDFISYFIFEQTQMRPKGG